LDARARTPEIEEDPMDESTQAPPPAGGGEAQVMRAGPQSSASKWLAVLGYIFVLVAVIALFIDPYKDEDFVRFHAIQAIALQVLIWLTGWIPIVGWIIAVVLIVFSIIAIVKAIGDEYYEVPVIYGFVKGWIGE
jgi:uncharacterized membrane protein